MVRRLSGEDGQGRSAVTFSGTRVHRVGKRPGHTVCGQRTVEVGPPVPDADLREFRDLYCLICYAAPRCPVCTNCGLQHANGCTDTASP